MAFIGIKIPHEVGRLLKKIDVPGKREADSEYHITIAFFGDDWPVAEAAKTLETTFKVLENFKPFKIKINKLSCFPKGNNGVPVLAKVDSDDIQDLNEKLKKAYDKDDIEYSKIHKDFKPHITLSYADDKIKDEKIDEIEFIVHELVLWCGDHGDDRLFVTFPLDNKKQKKTSYLINKTNVFYALAENPKAFFKQTTERRKMDRNITVDQAKKAKSKLKDLFALNNPEWYRGIGISKLGEDYCVKVYVRTMTNEIKNAIPSELNNVPIVVEAVGDIVAY